MPPIKVLGGQMRVKGRLKGMILWVMSRTGKQSHHVGGHSEIQRQKTNTTHKFRGGLVQLDGFLNILHEDLTLPT